MERWLARRLTQVAGCIGFAVWIAAGPALAAKRSPALPIGAAPIELGAGWDSQPGAVRGDPGACVTEAEIDRRDGPGPQYTIATLNRASGRLVVGVHVSSALFVETLHNAGVTDAARRLRGADPAGFRDLCGDGFVAARAIGGQFLAEIEVQRKDVAAARARLISGTWTSPEPFQQALEALLKGNAVTVRELPGGRRADARTLAPEALVSRAVAFPATVAEENAQPYAATFEPYSSDSFSGMPLSDADALDPIELAEEAFRDRSAPGRSTAARAADLRAAQVQRTEPEEVPPGLRIPEVRGPQQSALVESASLAESDPDPASEPELASERAGALGAAPPAAAASASDSQSPQLRSQPALVYLPPGELPVFATTQAPAGVYVERERERSYWVPGANTATPEVRRAIEKARDDAPARGTTVTIAEVGSETVVMTDAAPVSPTHSEAAGERRAWIAGVAAPNASQRAALAAAVEAEARAQ